MAVNTIDLKRGNSFRRTFQWRDLFGDPIDVTGASATFSILNPSTDTVILSATTESGEITHNATGGDITVTIAASATLIPVLKYHADLKVSWPSGEVISTDTFFVNVIKNIS